MDDYADRLAELRDFLWARLQRAASTAVAGISREYREVLAELRDMRTTQTEVSTVDQLAQRRAARLAAAQDRGDTAVRVHGGA